MDRLPVYHRAFTYLHNFALDTSKVKRQRRLKIIIKLIQEVKALLNSLWADN